MPRTVRGLQSCAGLRLVVHLGRVTVTVGWVVALRRLAQCLSAQSPEGGSLSMKLASFFERYSGGEAVMNTRENAALSPWSYGVDSIL